MALNSEQIRKQVEFYFSDSNYRTDKFLRTTCESNDGWIDIATILKFKRLSTHNITPDQLIQSLSNSKIVEIKENKIKKIINENYLKYSKENLELKIVGISGFDLQMTLEEIEYFLKKHCTPKLIRMRTDKKKQFNGQALVEVESVEEAEYLLSTKISCNYEELKEELKNNSENNSENQIKKIKKENNSENQIKKIKKENNLDNNSENNLKNNSENNSDNNSENQIKKIKKEDQPLKIMLKAELLDLNKTKEKEAVVDFKNKIYSYETQSDLKIKQVKEVIADIAFVDLKGKKIRFKEEKSFDEKEFEKENVLIKIKKLSDTETEEYIKSLNLKEKRKRSNK